MPRSASRVYGVLAALVLIASPALAQFRPRPISNPANGERFRIEGAAGFWNPSATMSISSESLGIPGTTIDFKKDLGLTDQRFGELHAVLRASRKHKFRFQYIPIKYEQRAIITRDIVFNGQLYRVGFPVNSELSWKAYRFGWEYDFLVRDRGFGGFILDFKYTDVRASLATPAHDTPEFASGSAPIPTLGGIVRVYVVPMVSITGELTGIKIPDSISRGLQDPLRRSRHLRHRELHQQHRRATRLPKLRRRLSRRSGYGVVHTEGAVLRSRGQILNRRPACSDRFVPLQTPSERPGVPRPGRRAGRANLPRGVTFSAGSASGDPSLPRGGEPHVSCRPRRA